MDENIFIICVFIPKEFLVNIREGSKYIGIAKESVQQTSYDVFIKRDTQLKKYLENLKKKKKKLQKKSEGI